MYKKIDFKSYPYLDRSSINLVSKLLKKKTLSNFVGSKVEKNIQKLLKQKSIGLEKYNAKSSFLGGYYVRKFESEWSKKTQCKYSISVNSATTAITVALLAADIQPGDEVITTPYTFTATVGAILGANGVPIFCDIEKDTMCIDPVSLENKISRFTKFIVVVHWGGNAGNLDKIIKIAKKYKIKIIEDASHSPGHSYKNKKIGNFGVASIFSFNQPKNLMTGEGGMLCTNNQNVARKSRLIRNHGEAIIEDTDTINDMQNCVGYNYRLTEIQAAIGCGQIKAMNKLNNIRKKNYDYLIQNIEKKYKHILKPQKILNSDHYAYISIFLFCGKNITRNKFLEEANNLGIPFGTGISRLMYEHPNLRKNICFGKKNFPWVNRRINYDLCKKELKNTEYVNKNYVCLFNMGWPLNKIKMKKILNIMSILNEKYFKDE
jgi:dTDP-4-amino-4,6-dideoxygalactose transaminase